MDIKKRVYYLLEPGDDSGRGIDAFIIGLILLNIISLVLETVESVYSQAPGLFELFEDVSLVIFAAEYLFRLWSCSTLPQFSRPILGRLRYSSTPMALIDLIAILPLFLPMIGADLRIMRAIRLVRLLRILKLTRYSSAMRLLGRVVVASRNELTSIFLVLVLLLLIAASLMYFAESKVQPDKFSSIPATMWWGIATLTTVGYGDHYPVTGLGQFIASFIAILGIGMFALPTGILGAKFVEELKKDKEGSASQCPHCGKALDQL